MISKKKILVTGGAGFIGSHVVDEALKKGFEVAIIDNYTTGRMENISFPEAIKIFKGDIANEEVVRDAIKTFSPDYIIHSAASFKDPNDWKEDIRTNVIGTLNVIESAKELCVKKIVYLQTSLCYGLHPLESPISINHPYFSGKYQGGSSYAISKTNGELYLELSGVNFVSLRLANVFGPRNFSGPIPTFYDRLNKKEQCIIYNTRRDFIFIQDVVDCIFAMLSYTGDRKYFNVSTGRDYSIEEVFEIMVEIMKADSGLRSGLVENGRDLR